MSKCVGKNCQSGKICNPGTGRCVNISGKIGEKLKSPKQKSPERKSPKQSTKCVNVKCKDYKICNPETGRCVNISGKIGGKLKTSKKSPKRSSPKRRSPKRSSPKRSSPKRRSPKRSSPKRRSPKIKHPRFMGKNFGKNYIELTNIDYVSGLSYFKILQNKKLNKIVYLLGEFHTLSSDCPLNISQNIHVSDFFFNLLNSTNKPIDVFLEFDYRVSNEVPLERFMKNRWESSNLFNERYYSPASGMWEIFNKLAIEGCLTGHITNDGCEYYRNRVRFHSGDVRDTDTLVNRFLRYIRFHIIPTHLINVDDMSEFKILEDPLIYRKLVYENLITSKAFKQIDNIADNNIKNIIKNEIFNEIEQQIEIYNYPKIMSFIEEYNNNNNNNNNNIITNLTKYQYKLKDDLFTLDCMVMDMYILGRMFRTFTNPKNPLINETEPSNIIIYSGLLHSKTYERHLNNLGFEPIYEGTPYSKYFNKNCTRIPDFKPIWI